MNDEQMFARAVQLSGDERREFIAQACGQDSEQRERVEKLLAAHETPDSLLSVDGISPTTAYVNDDSVGQQIGPYKLLQELGEGGMGTVYLAERQHPVKQRVALKIIKHGMDSKRFIARFEAERQALAMMDHPNIASVHDAGCTQSGRPYLVMEFVKGVPITTYCDQNKLSTRERLELFIPVCLAVQHAHQKGIIHRDLKPSNILVANYDDRPVPKVIDFGLAKAANQQLTDKTLFTEVGSILGTWEYMSPEQAVLNQLDVDTRTDVYALGVILYELLTGVTPLDRKQLREVQLRETLRIIQEVDPPKPSTRVSGFGAAVSAVATYRSTDAAGLSKAIRGDLDWITMKALEKDRRRRYEAASRLADDVAHVLAGEAVDARPPSLAYTTSKLWNRHKLPISTAALVLCSLVIASIVMTSLWLKGERLTKRLEKENERTQEALKMRQERVERQTMILAFGAFNTGDHRSASNYLGQLEPPPGTALTVPWSFLKKRIKELEPQSIEFASQVECGDVSPDGNYFVVGLSGGDIVVGAFDSVDRSVLSPQAFGQRGKLSFRTMRFSPDRSCVVAAFIDANDNELIQVFRANSDNPLTLQPTQGKLTTNGRVYDLEFIGDSDRFVFTDAGGTATLCETDACKVVAEIPDNGGQKIVACSNDGRLIMVGSWNSGTVRFFDGDGEKTSTPNISLGNRINALQVHPTDNKTFLAVGYFGAQLWRINDDQARFVRQLDWRRNLVGDFSEDGGRVAVWGQDDVTSKVYDVMTGKLLHRVPESDFHYKTKENNFLAFAGNRVIHNVQNAIRIASIPNNGDHSVSSFAGWYSDFTLSLNKPLVAFRHDENSVGLWDIETRTLHSLPVADGKTKTCGYALSASGDRLAVAIKEDAGTRIHVYDIPKKKWIHTLDEHLLDSSVRALQFSPTNNNLLVSSGNRTNVWLHELSTGKSQPLTNKLESGDVLSCEFSPSGSLLLVGDNLFGPLPADIVRHSTLFRIHGSGQKKIAEKIAEMPSRETFRAVINHLETLVARINIDRTQVELWDIKARKYLEPIPVNGTRLMSVAFSPNSECLVVTNPTGELKFLDYRKREEIGTFRVPHPLRHVRFQASHRKIVASSIDGRIMQWDY